MCLGENVKLEDTFFLCLQEGIVTPTARTLTSPVNMHVFGLQKETEVNPNLIGAAEISETNTCIIHNDVTLSEWHLELCGSCCVKKTKKNRQLFHRTLSCLHSLVCKHKKDTSVIMRFPSSTAQCPGQASVSPPNGRCCGFKMLRAAAFFPLNNSSLVLCSEQVLPMLFPCGMENCIFLHLIF